MRDNKRRTELREPLDLEEEEGEEEEEEEEEAEESHPIDAHTRIALFVLPSAAAPRLNLDPKYPYVIGMHRVQEGQ
jgi:hypothetical protein